MRHEFSFFQDSVLGKLLLDSWIETGGDSDELIKSVGSENPCFTPNSEKQVLMTLLPQQLRKHIEHGEDMLVVEKIEDLVRGNNHITPEPKLDIALELVEWILTGFEKDDLVMDLLNMITSKKLAFPPNFLEILRKNYVVLLNDKT